MCASRCGGCGGAAPAAAPAPSLSLSGQPAATSGPSILVAPARCWPLWWLLVAFAAGAVLFGGNDS